MFHNTHRAAKWAAGLFLLSGLTFGQAVTDSLVGTVTDSSAAAVPNAKVALVETRTGIAQTDRKSVV